MGYNVGERNLMIIAEQLTKRFDDFLAVDAVNLNVPTGQVLAILGPNGAGKTTTVRMLTSILRPTSGRAWVAGYDVVSQAAQVRAAVGVLTEHHGLYGRMNSVEYLAFYADLYQLPVKAARARAEQLLDDFGLSFARNKRLGEYSKGMRQKLALVRALLHDPPVLLLDEPTSAMDPESARMVRDAIRGLQNSDRTIVLCTHNLFEAEELADQVAIIRRGRIILNDTLPNLKQMLLGEAEFEAHFKALPEQQAPDLPAGVELTGCGPGWLRFRVPEPENANPRIIASLVGKGFELVSYQEVPRSLERAYMEAVSRTYDEEEILA
jgi:ABC-2 type transport system ATP-binding protein